MSLLLFSRKQIKCFLFRGHPLSLPCSDFEPQMSLYISRVSITSNLRRSCQPSGPLAPRGKLRRSSSQGIFSVFLRLVSSRTAQKKTANMTKGDKKHSRSPSQDGALRHPSTKRAKETDQRALSGPPGPHQGTRQQRRGHKGSQCAALVPRQRPQGR